MSINDQTTDGSSLTALGHPKMEKGKIPEENQVSSTSSSAAQREPLPSVRMVSYNKLLSKVTLDE